MRRALIFSLAYYPYIGGAEVALKEITDRISDIEFHMLTLRFGSEPREERIGQVVVHRIGGGSSYVSKICFVLQAAYAARQLHKVYRFDALWAMMSYMLFPIVLARLPVPYVLTLQEGDPFEHVFRRWFIRLFRPILSPGFSHATAVQAISTYLATWARHMGFQKEVDIIPNGVAVEHFSHQYTASEIEQKRIALGKRSGDVFLVTTSRLVHKNAIDDVLRALIFLPSNVHFLIYGVGPDEAMLKALAKNSGIEMRVHFLGQIAHSDMPLALRACDIFIRPSRSEGMGNSFVEAMASGLPVIATQEGGIGDFLFDATQNPERETTGWAVAKDSPEQIATAVITIMEHPENVGSVTRAAHRMVIEKYDWNLIATSMKGLFDRVFEEARINL